MADIDATDASIRDGRRVEEFLADPAVQAAFERLEKEYYARFKSSPAADVVTVHAMARALDDVKLELRRVIDTGKMAKNVLDRSEQRAAANRPRR